MVFLYVKKGESYRQLKIICLNDRSSEPPVNSGFSELQEVIFQGPACPGWRLLVDDAPLAPVADSPGEWKWTPGFYAGEVDVEMQNADNKPVGRWRLDVNPDPEKASREVFQQMLDDIRRYNPALTIGQEPAQRQFGALEEFYDPIIEFYRLRSRAEQIHRALAAVNREPVQTLRPRRHLTLPHLVRRADRQSARAALRQPVLLAIAGVLPKEKVSFTQPPVVDTPAVEYHYDNPANRCLLYMLRQLQQRCSKLTKKRLWCMDRYFWVSRLNKDRLLSRLGMTFLRKDSMPSLPRNLSCPTYRLLRLRSSPVAVARRLCIGCVLGLIMMRGLPSAVA